MKTLIIGFGHKARRGKDTVVNTIIGHFKGKYNIKRYSFADALKKEICGKEFELCKEHAIPYDSNPPMDDSLCNSIHGKQRKLLQWYGTEYRRGQDLEYWINKLKETLEKEKPEIALISDLRFLNEMQWIKESGGYTVNVDRVGFQDPMDENSQQHSSESELDGVDYDFKIAALDGNLDQLKKNAIDMFDTILETYRFETSKITDGQVTTEITRIWAQRDNPIYLEVSNAIEGISKADEAIEKIKEVFYKHGFVDSDLIIEKSGWVNSVFGEIINVKVLPWIEEKIAEQVQ